MHIIKLIIWVIMFLAEGVSKESLMLLNESDLKDFGFTLGPRKLLLRWIHSNTVEQSRTVGQSTTADQSTSALAAAEPETESDLMLPGSSSHSLSRSSSLSSVTAYSSFSSSSSAEYRKTFKVIYIIIDLL